MAATHISSRIIRAGGPVLSGLIPGIVNVNTSSTLCLVRGTKVCIRLCNHKQIMSRSVGTKRTIKHNSAIMLALGWGRLRVVCTIVESASEHNSGGHPYGKWKSYWGQIQFPPRVN